jgi:hypothetical protein
MLSTETITFGKYKNGTLNQILKDRSYCAWLLKQDWFINSYEYLYNRVKNYNPLDYFIYPDIEETTVDKTFLQTYKYFRLVPLNELKLPIGDLTHEEKICYSFYIKTVEDLKNKIISNPIENKYNIKAPVKWLQNFEKNTQLNRTLFKTFIDSYDLPNITYIVEDIKKEGGIEYKGAQSFQIAKKLSQEQENFWEQLLKNKYGESLGTQFQYENCIFDFINISTNTIFECKLGIKDWNQKQHTKYILTLDKYTIIYLIGYDCIINMEHKHIYTLDYPKYNTYLSNITLKKSSPFDKLIQHFQITNITHLHNHL